MENLSCNVARFLAESVARSPHQTAIRVPASETQNSVELSFDELDLACAKWVCFLKRKNIRDGDKVLLMLRPGLPLIQVCFSLFKMGAIPVVIDPGMGLKSFLNCVRHTKPQAMVGIPLAHLLAFCFRFSFRSLRSKIWVGRRFNKKISKVEADLSPAVKKSKDDLAAILFTSGSTGAPKGVCYEHGQFDQQVDLVRNIFQIEEGEVDLPLLPVFALFNPGLGMTTIVPGINPSKPASVDPASLVKTINENQVTSSFGSPAIWAKVVSFCEKTGVRMPSLKRLILAGAPVPPKLFRRLKAFAPNASLYSPYGATECLPVSVVESETVLNFSAKLTEKGKGTCVGKVLVENDVKIIEPLPRQKIEWDNLKELPLWEIGEILVTGPTVTRSYYGLEEETLLAKIIDDKGVVWHRMGDCGYFDSDRVLWFCGRMAERVITEKQIYHTDCCEGVFNAMEGVDRSALIGIERDGQTIPAIVIEGDAKTGPSLDELKERARFSEVTADIDAFYFDPSFPVDVRHNAKIHRNTLAEKFSK